VKQGGFKIGGDGFSLKQVMALGLDVTASFLAAGLGYPGDEDVIEKCRKMGPEDAWNVGEAIFKASFPKSGPQNFFQKVMAAIPEIEITGMTNQMDSNPS